MSITVQVESARGEKEMPSSSSDIKKNNKWTKVLSCSKIFTNSLEKGFER